jgi:hypothetical protein
MVRGVYSDVSSTAPRQCGGYQDRLTAVVQHPLCRKVMSGAINNASELKILSKQNVTN